MLPTKLHKPSSCHTLTIRFVLWITAEVLLNYVGVDDLADYSEFLFERPMTVIAEDYRLVKNLM
ncbi:hypothetical protein IQ260_28025 [Leptolyngbya cf. ectocarpi LEGE 11479]|uniref:Uncharacterized protein n=1 Tax=Leptolyngbya cf. ectocarpi LEGE 11479 TaxID=1828722 RepID=A0A928ZZY9_LEPEC|nr:hypothetical protein [Leptolyngbya cf. ectocarpi LEGE 11479]